MNQAVNPIQSNQAVKLPTKAQLKQWEKEDLAVFDEMDRVDAHSAEAKEIHGGRTVYKRG